MLVHGLLLADSVIRRVGGLEDSSDRTSSSEPVIRRVGGLEDIKQEVLENDKVVYHRRWTQLGREWLIGRFGIKAA